MPIGIKFSQFIAGGNLKVTDKTVGIRDGENAIFDDPSDGILDENGNYLLRYESGSPDAVNAVLFENSVAGNPAEISVDGSDADASLRIYAKGNGSLLLETPSEGDITLKNTGNGSISITSLGLGDINQSTNVGDINLSTAVGKIYFNGTAAFYGFTTDDTFSGASDEYAPSALAVKTYVSSFSAISNFFISTLVATTGNVSATYDNGLSGVGATLTATSNGAASIDGVSLSLGDIALFKDQSSAFQNGVYTVIQVGDGGSPAIYERYIYFDDSAEIKQGYTTFTVQGSLNSKKGYQVISSVNTIGVDDIDYQQITLPSLSSSTDDAIVRFDGTSGGQVQNSGITITDADILNGATQINVDNIRLDGNTVSSTDANGPITIDPHGTGPINLNSPTVIISTALQHAGDTNNELFFGTDTQDYRTSGSSRLDISDSGVRLGGAGARVTSISTDGTLASNSDTLTVTEKAVKTYADSVGGASVTLTSAGGTETLVNDGAGPALATKGVSAGTGISLSSSATALTVTNSAPDQTVSLTAGAGISTSGTYPSFTITNTDTGSAVTLTNAGTTSLVNDGTGPTLATKGLVAGTGISLGTSATDVTITNSDGASTVTLTSSGGTETLVNDGTGPALATKGLSAGTGISLSSNAVSVTYGLTIPVVETSGGTNQTSYTAGDMLYASASNTLSKLAKTNSAAMVTSSAGVPAWSSTMTNGQLIIGSTGATPTAATITAGSGISVTNGAASITIAATGGTGETWTEVTGTSQSMAVRNGYIANNAGLVTCTLPTTAAIGDFVMVDGKGAGLYRIAQNASQVIRTGTTDTTVGVGGSLTATNRYDCIRLRCITANTDWVIETIKGAFTIA